MYEQAPTGNTVTAMENLSIDAFKEVELRRMATRI
jgi:hypothetical protein